MLLCSCECPEYVVLSGVCCLVLCCNGPVDVVMHRASKDAHLAILCCHELGKQGCSPYNPVVFLQYKTSEVRSKCTGLMRVNLYKDQISPVGSMPPLPNDKALCASLRPAYNVLKAAGQQRAQGRPMYAITDDQKKAADSFLKVRRSPSTHVGDRLTICFPCTFHTGFIASQIASHTASLMKSHGTVLCCSMT